MKRREMLLGMLGIMQVDTGVSRAVAPKAPGICPACGEKAKVWDPDKPCRYKQQTLMLDDNVFIYDPFPGKIINPDAPKCGSVDLFTGTRDWRRHICHNCKNIYAIPKGFFSEGAQAK